METVARTHARRTLLTLRIALFAGGFTALSVQTLLLRELMVAWRGNEMSFGLALSVWLLLTGAGGLAYGARARRAPFTLRSLSFSIAALGALAPAALFAARFARLAMSLPAGELAGLPPLLLAASASLAPFTLLAGFVFAAAVSVLADERLSGTGATGDVYVLEAAGAVAGGAVLSFLLLGRWDPVRIAFLAMSLNSAVAFALAAAARKSGARSRGLSAAALTLTAAAAICAGPLGTIIDDASIAAQWRDVGFHSRKNSIYGLIVTTESHGQLGVYESGVLVASSPDRLVAEEAVHLTMLQHPAPRSVLLLGGGLGGSVAEILKHPSVEAVDYVELDPDLIRESRRSFGDRMTGGLSDPRVAVHFVDARFFVKRAARAYDVVIVNVPDPTTAQLNRFYTREFFLELSAMVEPHGVVGTSVSSAENYVSDELAAILGCVRRTLREAFDAVLLMPGDPCHFVASAEAELTRDPAVLSERIDARSLDVVYVRDYYLFDRLSPERARSLDAAIARAEPQVNADLSPTCYYMSLVLWNRQLAGVPGLLAGAPRFITIQNALLAALVVVVVVAAARFRKNAHDVALRRAVVAAVFVVGATEISLEIAAIMAFQSLYGYVYGRLALIVAAFMAGLAVGGLVGRRAAMRDAGLGTFAALQLGIALVPLLLARALVAVSALAADALDAWSSLFPLLVVGSAVLAGAQFPLAARLYRVRSEEPGTVAGRLYGVDLAGSALGATATAVFLLPVLGLVGAMNAFAVLNAGVLLALAVPCLMARRAV
jgi:spermidine synthase